VATVFLPAPIQARGGQHVVAGRSAGSRAVPRGVPPVAVRPFLRPRIIGPYRPYFYPYRYPYYYGAYYPYPYGYGYYGAYGSPFPSAYVTIGPDATYGSVKIHDAPRDAQVFVDGYYVGIVDDFNGTFQRLDLPAGPHRIEIRATDRPPIQFDVRIEPGQMITYHAR
jgi:hypothetical protein